MTSQIVLNGYALGQQIGVGQNGQVRVALNQKTGEQFAVKIIEKNLEGSLSFSNEVRILKALPVHPNIVKFIEAFETDSFSCIVTDFIEGKNLLEYLVERGTSLKELEARELFLKILDAVEALHNAGIVHRDLKLENIMVNMVDNHLKPTLIDFGFAARYNRFQPCLKRSCGSVHYAAPEIVNGSIYRGPEIDAWSLGVLLYVMVSGELPFMSENRGELFKIINHADFKSPSTMSLELENLIRRVLCPNPDNRFTLERMRKHPWTSGNTLTSMFIRRTKSPLRRT